MAYVNAACAVHVTIFSIGGKFHILHALAQATCSYALLLPAIRYSLGGMNAGGNKQTHPECAGAHKN